MAIVTRIHAQQFRNLCAVDTAVHARCNVIWGPNGSGKTSILEALYCVSRAKSFRASHREAVIQIGTQETYVGVEIQDPDAQSYALGYRKTAHTSATLQEDGHPAPSRIRRARLLPVQILTPASFKLWVDGPIARRAFLDWGVFHVEPDYARLHQAYQKALQHCNHVLRQGGSEAHLLPWERLLAEYGMQIQHQRTQYWEQFCTVWADLWPQMGAPEVAIALYAGWQEQTLEEALWVHRARAQRVGYVCVGPHRADIRCTLDLLPMEQIFSRGQLKRFICTLLLTQLHVMHAVGATPCVLLYDDLGCELDPSSRAMVLRLLQQCSNQVFLTALDPSTLPIQEGAAFAMDRGVLQAYA